MYSVNLETLNLDDGFHLLVEVLVFGQLFKAVVDTGASRTVLDKNTVENYIDKDTLLASDKLSTGLGTNSMESYTLTIPRLIIGDLEIADFETAVLDLSMINIAYQSIEVGPIIGVIGGDILMKYQATISYSSQQLTFEI
ncbi:MAG: clan AA aspartic protease [Sphingobacteriaceae bacterium]|nr:clan AA aspartic protease [Sphingobacteriaceae bacterium]